MITRPLSPPKYIVLPSLLIYIFFLPGRDGVFNLDIFWERKTDLFKGNLELTTDEGSCLSERIAWLNSTLSNVKTLILSLASV